MKKAKAADHIGQVAATMGGVRGMVIFHADGEKDIRVDARIVAGMAMAALAYAGCILEGMIEPGDPEHDVDMIFDAFSKTCAETLGCGE